MEELFSHILDDDEKIIKVFKPNKGKLFLSSIFMNFIWSFWFLAFGIFMVLFPDEGITIDKIYVLVPIGIYLVLFAFIILFTALHYKNVYYAYSNKRIIIRSGIFGVDYKSLDMSMIGVVDVYVSLFDKIIKKNTGSKAGFQRFSELFCSHNHFFIRKRREDFPLGRRLIELNIHTKYYYKQ